MDDVLDIIHKISFDIEDDKLDKLTVSLRNQISEIGKLSQRQVDYARLLKKMSLDETEARGKIVSQMQQNKKSIDERKKSLENLILTDKKFSDQLVKEQGLIGAVNTKLKILEDQRKRATSESDVKKYSQLISNEKNKLNNIMQAKQGGLSGLLSGFGGLGKLGSLTSMIPAIGGALSVGALASQIADVTKKFESYR
jgi:hypothetical protein